MKEKRITRRTYGRTWIALLVLSALTLLLSFAPLGRLHTPVALLIAGAKGTLVVLFFMHLVEERLTNRLVLVASVLLLAILIALTAADVATRRVTERAPVEG